MNVVKCNDLYYNCGNKEDIPDYARWGALFYTKDFSEIPSIAKNILTKEEVERIMDKIKKLQEDSLFMSELEALEWQEWEDRSILTEVKNQAYTVGMEQGLEQGLEQKTKEIILSMIKNNIPMETISKVTNKTINEIKKIINKN